MTSIKNPPRSAAVLKCAPGLVFVGLGVGLSYFVNLLFPVASALTLAVTIGVIARNTKLMSPRLEPGISVATKRLLRAGVVLLGLQLGVDQVLGLGAKNLVIVVATVAITFTGTQMFGRWMGVGRKSSLLIATGFAICGASAIAAMSGVIDGEDEDVATAVALVTLYGSLAIVFLPLLQIPLGLSNSDFGVWVGASVHEVAQVVAASSAAGAAALAVAVVVKLTRVTLLAPIVAGVSAFGRRRTVGDQKPPLVPLFVVGFLAMILLRSLGIVPDGVLSAAKVLTTLMLAGALFGLGTAVHLPTLVRTGGRVAALGAASTLLAVCTSLAGISIANAL